MLRYRGRSLVLPGPERFPSIVVHAHDAAIMCRLSSVRMMRGREKAEQQRLRQADNLLSQANLRIQPALLFGLLDCYELIGIILKKKLLLIFVQKQVGHCIRIAKGQTELRREQAAEFPGHRRQKIRLTARRDAHDGYEEGF